MKTKKQASADLYRFDQKYWQSGIRHLCGIDEAGRGPLAGPVVAAAVILNPALNMPEINDSKKISAVQREQLALQIKEVALDWGLGLATVQEIQQLNILKATFLAMQRALEQLTLVPDFLLIDGRDFPQLFRHDFSRPLKGQAVVGGDHLSQTIAAASILAKVHRDQLMKDYAVQYPQYGFEKHKGYATPEHRRKILELGPCPIHRQRFLRRLLNGQTNLFTNNV